MASPNALNSVVRGGRNLATWVTGLTFIGSVFVLLPSLVADLNTSLGWPQWQTSAGRVLGALVFAASLGLMLYCSRLFSRLGKGTPVPIRPPTELVVSGVYQFSRNPIYVGQVGVLLGYFLYSGKPALLLYALVWTVTVQLMLLGFEEPQLRKRFGAAYLAYSRSVPRWVALRTRTADRE